MNSPRTFNQIKPDLISMGFAFYGDSSQVAADPERTLLQIVELSQTERKTFVMLLAWLDKARALIHVERLKTLSAALSQGAIPVLGALCLKQVRAGDRRFSSLVTVSKDRTRHPQVFSGDSFQSDEYMISKHGLDDEFSEFGLQTARIAPADEKKILTWEGILSQNAWLRMRALMGANFRADMAYLMSSGRAGNANQAMRVLGCNLETAYRLWKSLSLAPDLSKLAG